MSVETPETFREQTLEWQSSHARELALAKQDITADSGIPGWRNIPRGTEEMYR